MLHMQCPASYSPIEPVHYILQWIEAIYMPYLKQENHYFFSQPKKLIIYSVLKTHPLDNTVAKIVQNREI